MTSGSSSAAPALTVAIAARNEERALGACLDAVLAQASPDVEVLVADDGSSDRTAAVAAERGPAVRVLRLSPRGPGAARNALVEAACGVRIAFLDADCVACPGWVEAARRPDTGAEAVRMGRVVSAGTLRDRVVAVACFGEYVGDAPRPLASFAFLNVAAPTALLRRQPVPEVEAGEDRLLAARLARAGVRIDFDPQLAVRHRPAVTASALRARQRSYAERFLRNRFADPSLPGGALLAWPTPLCALAWAAGRLVRDGQRLVAARRALGLPLIQVPAAALCLAAWRALDAAVHLRVLEGIWEGERGARRGR